MIDGLAREIKLANDSELFLKEGKDFIKKLGRNIYVGDFWTQQ